MMSRFKRGRCCWSLSLASNCDRPPSCAHGGMMLTRSSLPRVFDQTHDLFHPAPEFFLRDLDVNDVHGHTGAFADLNRFLDRIENAQPFIAHVRRVNAAV